METRRSGASAGVSALRSLLDEHEMTVLVHLCKQGHRGGVTSVRLAAEVYGPDHPVGWLATEGIIEGLCVFGLVRYRLGQNERTDPFHTIRPTRRGFAVAGVEWRLPHEVGQRPSARDIPASHAGDMTDFRRHGLTAVGAGAVERLDLVEHCEVHYDHVEVHWDQLDEYWERKRKENR